MSDKPDFELPSPSEKLSHKFIMDAFIERNVAPLIIEEEVIEAPIVGNIPIERKEAPGADVCGTQAAPVGKREEPPGEEDIPLPELPLPEGKKYFRIGEVSELIGVESYVLRYWESEFSVIRPTKSRSGHRVYSRRDVEHLHLIRHLLHTEKYSIKGAKKKIQERRHKAKQPVPDQKALREVLQELKDLIHLMKANPGLL